MSIDSRVLIDLSKEEAIVFFDWLVRFNKKENEIFEDESEKKVLWDIESILESSLTEPLSESYAKILELARKKTLGKS